ncbi:MAG: hypothetical protein AAB425_03595 [Bdellovibrionota bacterium]
MKAELDKLRAENAALKKTSARSLSLKVSEKGALSVYGLGRFPVTLYKEQWLKLLDLANDIRAFIQANDGQLKTKEYGGFLSDYLESPAGSVACARISSAIEIG